MDCELGIKFKVYLLKISNLLHEHFISCQVCGTSIVFCHLSGVPVSWQMNAVLFAVVVVVTVVFGVLFVKLM